MSYSGLKPKYNRACDLNKIFFYNNKCYISALITSTSSSGDLLFLAYFESDLWILWIVNWRHTLIGFFESMSWFVKNSCSALNKIRKWTVQCNLWTNLTGSLKIISSFTNRTPSCCAWQFLQFKTTRKDMFFMKCGRVKSMILCFGMLWSKCKSFINLVVLK